MEQFPAIRVSENRRFLTTATGEPFFWLGDTAWELFHRLTREKADFYLENRRRKGFDVILAVALAEFDGIRTPNAYGDYALIDEDPTRPNEAYFRVIDDVIDLAAAQGLYVGLLPMWGDKVNPMWGVGPQLFTPDNALVYGRWLGARYRNRSNILWVLGGDRPAQKDGDDFRPVWRALAAGIDAGTGARPFKTYHPWGGHSTSEELHDEPWLDLNLIQSGHGAGRSVPVWELIERDYALAPVKPTLDTEPNYEDHPISPWPTWNPANGYFRDHDVRQQVYRSVFAGGCGVTYGHHALWQFCSPRYPAINHPDRYWWEAMDRPGAAHLVHLRRLMESRPYFSRVPDDSLIASGNGAGGQHLCATRDNDGAHAMIYFPDAVRTATVDLAKVSGRTVRAWWYDPHTGLAEPAGEFGAKGLQPFTTPLEWHDWVLVLDDAAARLPVPGRK